MSGEGQREWRGAEPAPFGRSFVQSDAFRALFHEGMVLVEAAASYLDGPGREDARLLAPGAALAYARESMHLTTRLMQIAAWLLVQRAVAEGQLGEAEAAKERERVRLAVSETAGTDSRESLPDRLRDLIADAARLHARLVHLDRLTAPTAPRAHSENAVTRQQHLLRWAFSKGGGG